jgi:predicted peptidase
VPERAFQGTADELVRPLIELPVWAFHGTQDSIIPAAQSESLVAALRAAGGEAQLTLFPGVDHGAWDPAYRDPALPRWLLSQRRRTASNPELQEIPR